jgi:hypothetical protein
MRARFHAMGLHPLDLGFQQRDARRQFIQRTGIQTFRRKRSGRIPATGNTAETPIKAGPMGKSSSSIAGQHVSACACCQSFARLGVVTNIYPKYGGFMTEALSTIPDTITAIGFDTPAGRMC